MARFCGQLGLLAVLLLAGAPAWASFMASDLVYVPVAAHNSGVEGSVWRTDLTIANVETTDAVDVAIYFMPSGAGDNSTILDDRTSGLGGRDSEGWGHVDASLADIPPGGSVTLRDVVGQYWSDQFGTRADLGGLVVFAYQAGTLDAGGDRQYRNVVVQSRTYNDTTVWVPDPDNTGQFIQKAATYGQTIPGVPWYNVADAGFTDLSYQLITGAAEDDDFRFNVGVFNTSDPQTTLLILVEPFGPDGVQLVDGDGNPRSFSFYVAPLQHEQYNQVLSTKFGLTGVSDITLKVSIASYSTTGTKVVPTMVAYGSLVDNRSNDPTTVLPSFSKPYDVECVWSSRTTSAAATGVQQQTIRLDSIPRPLEIPAR